MKLADFGVARSLAATRQTEVGTVLGTAAYLSPEQARGDPVTAAADIYSLGVVLYELLTGATPYTADTLSELVLKREQGAAPPPSELAPETPAAVEDVIMRCLALQPEYRPASAAVLASELAASVDEPVTEPLPAATGVLATDVPLATAATAPLRRSRGARRLGVALAVGALLALGVGLVFTLSDSGSSDDRTSAAARGPSTTMAVTRRATTASQAASPAATTTSTTAPAAALKRPTTPAQAVAAIRAAIAGAYAGGELDSKAADGLGRELDRIEQALDRGETEKAADKTASLVDRLGKLVEDDEEISAAALSRIQAPLGERAIMLAATSTVTESPPAHGKGKGKKKGKKKH